MAQGHTYTNLTSSNYIKNINSAKSSIDDIVKKVQAILTSLDGASGTEIAKVKSKLKSIKNGLSSLSSAITSSVDSLKTRAMNYDDIYDSWKAKKNSNEKLGPDDHYYTGQGVNTVFIFENEYRTNHTIVSRVNDVSYNDSATGKGLISLQVRYDDTYYEEETGVTVVFTGDDYHQVGEKKTSTSYKWFTVYEDGSVGKNITDTGTYWNAR